MAADTNEVPLNFDTQLVRIIEAGKAAQPGEAKILERILGKLRDHKMMLKNAVYRTDMGVIRLTWADDANEDVVKIAYKTAKDPVLGNSLFADKRQMIDAKIMYRTEGGAYAYLRLQNQDNELDPDHPDAPIKIPPQPTFNFRVESHMPDEQCRFCHILAQHDGSVSGVFFPRYQEDYKPTKLGALPFRTEHFRLTSAAETTKLGLPAMSEDFLYQKVDQEFSGNPQEYSKFARTLIELPQLVEVMARDNKQSMCVTVDFGTQAKISGLSRHDYVCADNKAQKLLVRMTNIRLTTNGGSKEYAEPYFAKY